MHSCAHVRLYVRVYIRHYAYYTRDDVHQHCCMRSPGVVICTSPVMPAPTCTGMERIMDVSTHMHATMLTHHGHMVASTQGYSSVYACRGLLIVAHLAVICASLVMHVLTWNASWAHGGIQGYSAMRECRPPGCDLCLPRDLARVQVQLNAEDAQSLDEQLQWRVCV